MGKIIGIDLGTTNSVVAVMEGGEPTVIASAEGGRTVPSVVAFTKTGERLVGQLAKRQAVTNPGNTVYSIKRFMGRRWDDPEVKHSKGLVPYTVEKDPKTRRHPGQGRRRQVVLAARDQRDDPPEAQGGRRGLPRREGDRGGHHRARPTSTTPSARRPRTPAGSPASTSSGSSTSRPRRPWPTASTRSTTRRSPSTTSAAARSTSRSSSSATGVFEVKSTNGDTHLGGDDFDQRVIDWLLAEFKKDQGIDLSKDPQALQRLKEAAEKAKIELSLDDRRPRSTCPTSPPTRPAPSTS